MLFLSGCVANQGVFYPRFGAVVLLSAPADVILERVAGRGTNDYGKTDEQRAFILEDFAAVEPRLRARATAEIDTRAPLARSSTGSSRSPTRSPGREPSSRASDIQQRMAQAGQLRAVDSGLGQSCQANEVGLNWSQSGAKGATGPQGAPGAPGANGATGPQGPAENGPTFAHMNDVLFTIAPGKSSVIGSVHLPVGTYVLSGQVQAVGDGGDALVATSSRARLCKR